MKSRTLFYAFICTLSFITPLHSMERPDSDGHDQPALPLSGKIQAGFAAAAPLLIFPPVVTLSAALISVASTQLPAAIPHIPSLAARSIPASICTEPFTLTANTLMPARLRALSKWVLPPLISERITNLLTQMHIIPQEPPVSNVAEAVTHAAIRMATNAAATTGLRHVVFGNDPHARERSIIAGIIDNHYTAKEKIIRELRKKYSLTQAAAPSATAWNPGNAESTKHITLKTTSGPLALPYTDSPVLDYQISQSQSAIIISETILDQRGSQVKVSKYDTEQTSWAYHLPIPFLSFYILKPAMKQLRKDVIDNHVTMIGRPLKDVLAGNPDVNAPSDDASIDL